MITDHLVRTAVSLTERGLVPDAIARAGIRRLCGERLASLADASSPADFAATLGHAPLAVDTGAANDQHYEIPAEFFGLVLGRHRKYSCGYWPRGVETLDEAETAALEETARRADLDDGQDILELGCGWGSLTLWMAEHFPAARITGVSNSASQRAFILDEARRGLDNVRILTRDINDLVLDETFDRVVSVEMFEHVRNHRRLFERIAGWLRPGGFLFAHVFCHRSTPYLFETTGPANWMGRHFFTGGMMPSADLFEQYDEHLRVEQRWTWSGVHYERTANAWLQNLDARGAEVLEVMAGIHGRADARRWRQRWRLFFMACAELFGYDGGEQWQVRHLRFAHVDAPAAQRPAAVTVGV